MVTQFKYLSVLMLIQEKSYNITMLCQKYQTVQRYLILFCSTLLSYQVLFAQQPSLHFEQLGNEQGLSQNIILSFQQDDRGFMWFGSTDGLIRYDGYVFKVFKHVLNDSTSLSNNYIQSLYKDREGIIWIGTLDGLNRYDSEHGTFRHYRYDPKNPFSITSSNVVAIHQDHRGIFWIGTNAGLNKFDPVTEQFYPYQNTEKTTQHISSENISSICQDGVDNLWIGTWEGGLYKFDIQEETIQRFRHKTTHSDSLYFNFIRTLLIDQSGMLWIGTDGGGLFSFNQKTEVFEHFQHNPKNNGTLSHNAVRSLHEDQHGNIWIGTDGGGVDLYDRSANRFINHNHDNANIHSLSNNRIVSIFEDNTGILWLGTWGAGVNKYNPGRNKFFHEEAAFITSRLSSPFVLGIYEDKKGNWWIGTHNGGVNKYDRKNKTLKQFKHDLHNKNSLSNNVAWSIAEDDQGYIWIATDIGLNRLNPETEHFDHYFADVNNPHTLSSNFTGTIVVGDSGYLWIATNKNLNKFDPRTERFKHITLNTDSTENIGELRIQALYEDLDGYLWICMDKLYKYDKTKGIIKSYEHNPKSLNGLSHKIINCFYMDANKVLWIGTYGGGLNKLVPGKDEFIHYTEKDGLPDNVVYGILEDDYGNLWISTNQGLSKFNPQTESFTNYDINDGLQDNEFNRGGYLKTQKGEMLFGGINGLNVFYPNTVQANLHIPPVVLTSFKIFEQPVKFDTSLTHLTSIKIPYTDNYFAFEFAALDYAQPSKNQYAYYLDGLDKDWIYSGNRRYTSYTNLNPGEYIFKARGSNNDGLWNEKGVSLNITITPPFWQTWWFRAIGFCMVALFIAGGIAAKKYYREYRRTKYISHFKIIKKVGEGGMGVVYKATDKNQSKIVALKVLNDRLENDREGVKRFLKEAEIARQLKHENIVKIFNAGSDENIRYISMEFLEGNTLKAYIQENGQLTTSETLDISLQILAGLNFIHENGVIHRDLKSENIMLLSEKHVKIMDFGLARSQTLTTINNRDQLMGTLAYMSPEQTIGNHVDHRSDIYSFGIILYEMTFGKLPFLKRNEMAQIYAIHNEIPPNLNDGVISTELTTILTKCLEKEPVIRYQSVSELIQCFTEIKKYGINADLKNTGENQ